MSSPAARAQARRKAILSRGGDRLAKLTTSARGEDCLGQLARRRSAAFVGEETNMPPPPPPPKDTPRPSPPPPAFTAPSVWSEEQQHEFMQALMGGALNPSGSFPSLPPPPPSFETPPRADDPFATMMAQMSSVNAAQGVAGKAPTLPQAADTVAQMDAVVTPREPQVFVEKTAGAVEVAFWKRWPKLVNQGTFEGTWGVQVVSFFWAFMTLQVMLHSLRIFGGHNDTQPPALLTVVLPHLPPPLPSVILNGLGYLRMGNAFLDDMAAIVFGIGMLIVITSWFAD
ncbi:hypothetical protein EV363DRAFT_1497151 [Boletus edulis]|nr:hypothetical protein EV363DRAFT_1497151 [Boletus edulis]